jgi:hypothetical protein
MGFKLLIYYTYHVKCRDFSIIIKLVIFLIIKFIKS